jgi:hypothetical protein
MKHKLLKSALCLCLLLPACDNQQKQTTSAPPPGKPATATIAKPEKAAPAPVDTQKPPAAAVTETPKTTAPAGTGQQGDPVSGKVLETMDAGGYTYLQVDTGKTRQWVAIPQAKVKVGDEVSYHNGMVMPNFTSKSLNRTFDSVVFSTGLVGQVDQAPPQADPHDMNNAMKSGMNPHATKQDATNTAGADSFANAVKAETPPAAMQAKTESGGSLGAMAPFTEIKVDKAAGENAYTVGEIFADNAKLDGKTIRVKAKVVKFNPNIMGKNWIHLQDGSGDPLKNTHDLVITTSAQPPKDNDVITIEGIVRANKDFGAGYNYVVLIEDAKIIQ